MAANMIGGGIAGSGAGALAGSAFGPIGTGVGALIGGAAGLFAGSREDKARKVAQKKIEASNKGGVPGHNLSQFSLYTPQQQDLQNSIIGQIQALLGGQGGLSPISKNAVQRFNTETVPGLAERFTALGSGGSQRSSAFQGALGSAGTGLQQQLAGQDINYLLSLLGPALGQSQQHVLSPNPQQGPGFGEQAGVAALNLLPQYLQYQMLSNQLSAANKQLGGGK